eukprot:scaffold264364_cov21-Tisochrysis_lutea.AAC.1
MQLAVSVLCQNALLTKRALNKTNGFGPDTCHGVITPGDGIYGGRERGSAPYGCTSTIHACINSTFRSRLQSVHQELDRYVARKLVEMR